MSINIVRLSRVWSAMARPPGRLQIWTVDRASRRRCAAHHGWKRILVKYWRSLAVPHHGCQNLLMLRSWFRISSHPRAASEILPMEKASNDSTKATCRRKGVGVCSRFLNFEAKRKDSSNQNKNCRKPKELKTPCWYHGVEPVDRYGQATRTEFMLGKMFNQKISAKKTWTLYNHTPTMWAP